jgi:hypothetical protein
LSNGNCIRRFSRPIVDARQICVNRPGCSAQRRLAVHSSEGQVQPSIEPNPRPTPFQIVNFISMSGRKSARIFHVMFGWLRLTQNLPSITGTWITDARLLAQRGWKASR